MLADEKIRLVPLTPAHEPELAVLTQDEDVRRYTRVPTEPDPDFAAAWLERYEEGWREGSRAGFAIETHDGAFLGLGLFVRIEGEVGRARSATSSARPREEAAWRRGRSGC
jgi:RimJ/RimL family protein N-acetyltransferase